MDKPDSSQRLPKVNPNFLLQIKSTNPDLFYKIVAELHNDDLTQICSLDIKFRGICRDPEFWERLWRMKFNTEPPEEVKKEYLNRNFLWGIASFMLVHRENDDALWKGTHEQIIEILQNVLLLGEKDKVRLLNDYKTESIILGNSDLFLFAMLNGSQLDEQDVRQIAGRDEEWMVEKLISNLSSMTIYRIFDELTLSQIIRLLITHKDCHLEMIQEIFEAEIESVSILTAEVENFEHSENVEKFTEEIERSIEEAYRGDCQEVIDYLMTRTSRIDFVNQRALKTSLAMITLFKGDFERFVNYGQGISVNRAIARIPKNQDKFIQYLIENGNYDLAEDLEYELSLGHHSTFMTYFPALQNATSDKLINIIHGYTGSSKKNREIEEFLINNIDPNIMRKALKTLARDKRERGKFISMRNIYQKKLGIKTVPFDIL